MKNYIKNILVFVVCISVCSCKTQYNKQIANVGNDRNNRITELLKQLNNSTGTDILVVAHRSDWRNFPENSLEAMESSITMGVDMLEMDVAKTSDNQLIIMHDKALDRTTTGKGLVSSKTLKEIRQLYLKNGAGIATKYKVPTLEEALLVCKGKILVNLDKSYKYFEDAYRIAKITGTTNQIVIKGFDMTVDRVTSDFGTKLDTIIFMPVVNLDKQKLPHKIVDDYQTKLKVKAIEFVFSKDTSGVIKKFPEIKERGSRIWVNSLWGTLNADHEDDLAVKNPDSIYGWYIDKGVNMIQTDRPQLLLEYLRSKGLHK